MATDRKPMPDPPERREPTWWWFAKGGGIHDSGRGDLIRVVDKREFDALARQLAEAQSESEASVLNRKLAEAKHAELKRAAKALGCEPGKVASAATALAAKLAEAEAELKRKATRLVDAISDLNDLKIGHTQQARELERLRGRVEELEAALALSELPHMSLRERLREEMIRMGFESIERAERAEAALEEIEAMQIVEVLEVIERYRDAPTDDSTSAPVADSADVLRARLAKVEDVLDSIRQYGSDTLSGNAEGPTDAPWLKEAVREMVRRATHITYEPARTREGEEEKT